MSLTKRLKFWLWRIWLDHPIIAIATASFGFFLLYQYNFARYDDIWDGSQEVQTAEIVSFTRGASGLRARTSVRIRFEDGSERLIRTSRLTIERCKVGDKLEVERKGNRARAIGIQCGE